MSRNSLPGTSPADNHHGSIRCGIHIQLRFIGGGSSTHSLINNDNHFVYYALNDGKQDINILRGDLPNISCVSTNYRMWHG